MDDMLTLNPALKRELEECDKAYETMCKTLKKQPGYVVDWPLVNKAWETAKKLHGATRRKSGELYVNHPRSVMEELAKLRCKSSVLAAALLHDTMEDCALSFEKIREDFSHEVAQIVSAVTAIKAEEKAADPHYASMNDDEKHAFLDRLTDAKLIASPYQREAFLVRFADRAHNLSTIDACSTGKRLEKIASTRAFLIPAARKLDMRYFEVVLSDLCMKYDGESYADNESVRLLESRTALTRVSSGAYSHFDEILKRAVDAQSTFSFPTFNPFAKLRGTSREGSDEMHATKRRVLLPYELKQQLRTARYFERSLLDLWEIILTCKDRDEKTMLSKFIDMYSNELKRHGIFMQYLGQEKDVLFLRLRDTLENNYRIVLVPESKLESYFIGDPKGARLTMINEAAPGDALRPQITVYSYSKKKGYRMYAKCVPSGATALDFAFIVSPALAVTVKSARIHQWNEENHPVFKDEDYAYPLQTILSDGDVVNFEADYYPRIPGQEADEQKTSKANATFNWFAHINTECAKNYLIRYFLDKFPNQP